MHIALRLLCAMLVLAAAALSATAQVRKFRDWLAACDNIRTCAALGVTDSAAGVALRIDRDGAGDAAPRYTVLVEAEQGTVFTLAFDDASLGGLPTGPHSKNGEESTRIVIAADAAETFLASLRKAGRIVVTRTAPRTAEERIVGEISLAGAVAAMLWLDEQQKRLDTVTALVRRGAKPASTVPAPPALPVVRAAKADAAPANLTIPPAVRGRGRAVCGDGDPNPEPGEANALANGLMLYWFSCRQMSGAYNHWSGLLIAPRDNPQAARFVQVPYPPGERAIPGIEKRLLVNAGFDEKTLTLTMFAKSRGIGDCGSAGEWVFDGREFRLTRYQSMPVCGGLISDEWPVIYRAKVEPS